MKLLLIKIAAFFLITLFLSFSVFAETSDANYLIKIGGINIGTIKWGIDIQDKKYTTFIQLRDKGLLSGIFKFSGNYSSEGKILGGSLVSSKYKQSWKTKRKKRTVEILFKNKSVYYLSLNPKEKAPYRIDYVAKKDLIDPLSSFINILMNNYNNFTTIDGRRLYKMIVDDEKLINNSSVKKILITNYSNIWANHNKNDLKLIEVEHIFPYENKILPDKIKINHKGLVFKLTKI